MKVKRRRKASRQKKWYQKGAMYSVEKRMKSSGNA
jgi:hypothetical protein